MTVNRGLGQFHRSAALRILLLTAACWFLVQPDVAPQSSGSPPTLPPELEKVRSALEKHQDPIMAVHDGYFSTVACVEYPSAGGPGQVPYPAGGMGVHFLNLALLGPEVDPFRPQILVYEPVGDQLRLVAWERDIAVLGAFATAHVDKHTCTVNLGNLQVGAFLKPQAAGVAGDETHPVAQQFQVRQNGAGLFDTDDDREFLFPWGSEECQRGQFLVQGVFIEKLDAAQGHGTGTARVVLDVLEIEEVVTEFFLRDAVGGLVLVLRQLADGPDVHLLGPCGQASVLQVGDHPLAQLSHGYTSCT
jgi:hypothetical protein